MHMNLEALALERDRNDARDLEILRAGLAALGDSTLNPLTRSVPKSSRAPPLCPRAAVFSSSRQGTPRNLHSPATYFDVSNRNAIQRIFPNA